MKKLLCIVLVLGIVFGFAGCGNSTDDSATNDSTSTNTEPIKMGRVEAAAHGTKCFTVAVAAVQGDTIVGASLDDYQFMSTDVATGVPNSDAVNDGDFATNFKDPAMVLASKKANAEYYSEHMKEAAGSTVPLDENYAAVEAYVTGKTISELEKVVGENDSTSMIDVVTGSTLADTFGYVNALLDAAKAAK